MSLIIREGFDWSESEKYAEQLKPSRYSDGPNALTIAECVVSILNRLVPEYDDNGAREKQYYSPKDAIREGKTRCKTRAYMAHLITSKVSGINSGVILHAYKGHAATYLSDGVKAAVVDSKISKVAGLNSYYRGLKPNTPELEQHDEMLDFFRTTKRTDGFAWLLEYSDNRTTPDGVACRASVAPLDGKILNLDSMLMIGASATNAMSELLWAKQEMSEVIGPDLPDLKGDSTLIPNALVTHPDFS